MSLCILCSKTTNDREVEIVLNNRRPPKKLVKGVICEECNSLSIGELINKYSKDKVQLLKENVKLNKENKKLNERVSKLESKNVSHLNLKALIEENADLIKKSKEK